MGLSFSDLEQLWQQAGGSPQYAPTAAGIALAESGGDPGSLNNTPAAGDYSVGLYQINYYGDLYNSRTSQFGPPSALKDPLANTKAAVSLSGNGATWQPWVTDPVGNAAIAARTPLSAQQVQAILAGSGRSTGGTATDTSTQGSTGPPLSASAGGGQAGDPYVPSAIPGVPLVPPAAPDFTANPVNEAGRILSFIAEFGAWSIFTTLVFIIGVALLSIGALLIGVVLLGPVAKPAAEVVGGRTLIGRAVKRNVSRSRSLGQGQGQGRSRTSTGSQPALGSGSSESPEARAERLFSDAQAREGGRQRARYNERERQHQRERDEGFSSWKPPKSKSVNLKDA